MTQDKAQDAESFLCTATIRYGSMDERNHRCYEDRTAVYEAPTLAALYQKMALARIKYTVNADEEECFDESCTISFGTIRHITARHAPDEAALAATPAWQDHVRKAEAAERERLEFLAEQEREEAEQERQRARAAEEAEMAAYRRVKARLEGG